MRGSAEVQYGRCQVCAKLGKSVSSSPLRSSRRCIAGEVASTRPISPLEGGHGRQCRPARLLCLHYSPSTFDVWSHLSVSAGLRDWIASSPLGALLFATSRDLSHHIAPTPGLHTGQRQAGLSSRRRPSGARGDEPGSHITGYSCPTPFFPGEAVVFLDTQSS